MVRLTDDQAQWLLGLLNGALGRTTNNDAAVVANTIREQLASPRHFEDLVDVIARVVMDPRIQMLKSPQLDTLRKALLSPRELAKFSTVSKLARCCVRCAEPFTEYESATMLNGDAYCHRCAHPEYVTCRSCNGLVSVAGVQKTIQRHLQRHTCRPEDRVPMATNESVAVVSDGRTWNTARIPQDGPSGSSGSGSIFGSNVLPRAFRLGPPPPMDPEPFDPPEVDEVEEDE